MVAAATAAVGTAAVAVGAAVVDTAAVAAATVAVAVPAAVAVMAVAARPVVADVVIAADAAVVAVAAEAVTAAAEAETIKRTTLEPVQLLVLAFGDRPLDESEREWLEGEVRAAFRERSAAPGFGFGAEPTVLLYEERLDDEVVETLERKRGPAAGSGWRGFYDLQALDPTLPAEDVLDAARFLAHRSREKVIVPLFVEANGGVPARATKPSANPDPEVTFWEREAKKFAELSAALRGTLQRRWSKPPRGRA